MTSSSANQAKRFSRTVQSVWIPFLALGLACGGSTPPPVQTAHECSGHGETAQATEPTPTREAPPASATPRDLAFPDVARTTLANGLELNVAENHNLPLVYFQLVIHGGSKADPRELPGMASLVTDMLKEGTRRHTSAQLAEEIEFMGATYDASSGSDSIELTFAALKEHVPAALALLADLARTPRFDQGELDKLKRRELDRLNLSEEQPNYLARREFYRALYGEGHPYAHSDTNPDALARVKRTDLQAWHRTYFRPDNAALVVVGDVSAVDAATAVQTAFGSWARPTTALPTIELPPPPARTQTTYVIVSRPGAVQTSILLGNASVARGDQAFTRLAVANQVLGGTSASRLFMDLRERRSLTYGAYSQVGERVGIAPFIASTSVRTDVTLQTLDAFMENFQAITTTAPPAAELLDAQRSLSDSFPLEIDTAGKIANMIANARVFGLSDDYWDTYRTAIRQVTAAEALQAAATHIRPSAMLVVLVGDASQFASEIAEHRGPVTLLDTKGAVLHGDAPAAN